MKKHLNGLLVFICSICMLTGCAGVGSPVIEGETERDIYEFSYKVERTKFAKGEQIVIQVTYKNKGQQFSYRGDATDLFGDARLILNSSKVEHQLEMQPLAYTDDATERVFGRGETATRTYYFFTDENTPEGFYNLEVSFHGLKDSFVRVISVEEPLSKEEQRIREVADAAIMEQYPVKNLDPYKIEVSKNDKGTIWVRYKLYLGGYYTSETYKVEMTPEYEVKSVSGEYGEYACYLDIASVKDFNRAKDRIAYEAGKYGESPSYSLGIDDEGNLCLHGEIIVSIENPTGVMQGCGIDHEHIFFKEIICNKNGSGAAAESYKITMKNPDWLYEPLEDEYTEGETVTVKIHIATDIGYLLMANGEPVEEDESSGTEDWWQFSFVMPAKDVVLDFKTYDGFLQHAEEAVVMREFWIDYPESDYVTIQNYYGKFESGAIVVMINSGDYTQALWEENIAHFNIRYNNGNRILVLYNGAFFTLTDAYTKGHLTNQDMANIENVHRSYYEFLYSNSE